MPPRPTLLPALGLWGWLGVLPARPLLHVFRTHPQHLSVFLRLRSGVFWVPGEEGARPDSLLPAQASAWDGGGGSLGGARRGSACGGAQAVRPCLCPWSFSVRCLAGAWAGGQVTGPREGRRRRGSRCLWLLVECPRSAVYVAVKGGRLTSFELPHPLPCSTLAALYSVKGPL